MADVTSLSLSDIRKGLDSKAFSSKELTENYLKRIEQHKDLNGYIEVDAAKALKSAQECDQQLKDGDKAPLLGVPIAVKDVISTKGMRTTCGSKMLENYIAPYDATVIEKLKKAGAFVLGKTNMDEFAMGSSNETSYFGPARNPWNKDLVPGGSSGGSAVAVAASLAPISLGTDTGGSIRQPASLCGIVGMKPTYGRVSRFGLVAYASSLDQIGVFSRNVRDCAVLSEVLFGHDVKDSTSVKIDLPKLVAGLGQDIKGLRVGLPKEYFIGGIKPEVAQSVKDAIAVLSKLGAEVVDISLPHTQYALPCYYIIALAEASSNLARYDGIRYGHRSKEAKDLTELYCRSRSEGFGKEVKRRIMVGTYVLSAGYYDAYYLRAQKVRALIARDFKNVFEKSCDVIVCPTSPGTAFKVGEKISDLLEMYLNDVFTVPLNLAGLPGLSVPCGFDSQGLPIGLQIIGKSFDEATLLKVAHAYETQTEWHKKFAGI